MLSDEEKKAYDNLIMLEYFTMEKEDKEAIQNILNLIETQQKEIAQKDNIIDAMAEQLATPVHNKQWVIDYFEGKVN